MTTQTFLTWTAKCNSLLVLNTGNFSFQGEDWAFGEPGLSFGNTLLPPNSPYTTCSANSPGAGTLPQPGVNQISSNHPGGANILMCDGSVKFLKNSVNIATVWALGSKAQGRGDRRFVVLRRRSVGATHPVSPDRHEFDRLALDFAPAGLFTSMRDRAERAARLPYRQRAPLELLVVHERVDDRHHDARPAVRRRRPPAAIRRRR